MAILDYQNVGISALAAAVPSFIIQNRTYQVDRYGEKAITEIVDKIGVKKRHIAADGMCASDLCLAAAEKLISDNKIDKSSIDLLAFVTETPDQRMPGNAFLLHKRLHLGKHCICLDLPQCCAGFPYALGILYSMVQSGQLKRALLLNGDTLSRIFSPKDRSVAFLFGDAGTAALIEYGQQYGKSAFSLNSDGTRAHYIEIPAGGLRLPSSDKTLREYIVDEHGNMRSDENARMLGGHLFGFVLMEVPRDAMRLLKHLGRDFSYYQHVVFHQSNLLINSHLSQKLKLSQQQILSSIEEYGNTSSASIPLTIIHNYQRKKICSANLLLSAYGVGMSWATASICLSNCNISSIEVI